MPLLEATRTLGAASPRSSLHPCDLHLASADTCAKDNGDALPYPISSDMEHETRPYGARWDIGADEWNGGFFWDSLETGDLSKWSDQVP